MSTLMSRAQRTELRLGECMAFLMDRLTSLLSLVNLPRSNSLDFDAAVSFLQFVFGK